MEAMQKSRAFKGKIKEKYTQSSRIYKLVVNYKATLVQLLLIIFSAVSNNGPQVVEKSVKGK